MVEKNPQLKIEEFPPNPLVIESEALQKKFEAANEHRDYSVYERSMDAALEAKASSIFPYFNIEEGDVIVDAGSGTGALAELAAREFRGAKVYALDISHELQERTKGKEALTYLVYGDASQQNFPENSVKVKYYSTSGHEIESFGGQGAMRRALKNTFRELAPGGRVVIRDLTKPSLEGPVYMKILSRVGLEAVPAGLKDEDIDYSLLSASALLERFQKEFQGGSAFSYERVMIDGEEYIRVGAEWAHEFYLRKDYIANWRQEIKEKYTYWTMEEAQEIMEELGYVNVRVIPDPNEWILKNRLEGKIELYLTGSDGKLHKIPLPATHMVVVGEKPTVPGERRKKSSPGELLQAVDYKKILSSIKIDKENNVVVIGEKSFQVESSDPLISTKKFTFKLAGEPPRTLKIVRPDTRNDHNVFRAMFQTVERKGILDDFDVPHLRILDKDKDGPPFRYMVQEAVPTGSLSVAELISQGALKEEDIRQLAEIVNRFEKGKRWQIDTNPFNWYKVWNEDGSTQMVYADGKVYLYDEKWEFRRVGLLQWIDARYVRQGRNLSAAIPSLKEYEKFRMRWRRGGGIIDIWKKYLDPLIQP